METFVVGVCAAAGAATVVGVWAVMVMRGMDRRADNRLDVECVKADHWQDEWRIATSMYERLTAQAAVHQVEATEWKGQATMLAKMNDRLLDELAAARLDAGQSARDILAAFTAPPPADTPPPADGFGPTDAMADVDAALLAAAGEPDWTDGMGWIGVAQDPARPPDFTSDIPAAEDHANG